MVPNSGSRRGVRTLAELATVSAPRQARGGGAVKAAQASPNRGQRITAQAVPGCMAGALVTLVPVDYRGEGCVSGRWR
jgi:hypothetical protein